mgnify:CR=1 FL=1
MELDQVLVRNSRLYSNFKYFVFLNDAIAAANFAFIFTGIGYAFSSAICARRA